MADHYEYHKLSDKAKDLAISKLKENPEEINEHIENFRNLMKSKPHLDLPTDTHTLLKFLRVAKFDYKKAEAKLDNFCTLKGSTRGVPEFFDQLNLDEPIFQEFVEKAMIIPLGSTDDGNFIVLMRPCLWNPATIPFKEAMNLIFMSLDMMIEEEEMQVYGIKIVYDMSDVPRQTLIAISDSNLLKNISRIFHESYPIRLKEEIFYNEPESIDNVFKTYTHFMNDKARKRVSQVRGDIKNLMEKIPGIEKLMPTEYGGEGGSISDIKEELKEKFMEYFKDGNPRLSVSVDESKRPEETLSYLNEYDDYTGPTLEME